MSELIKHHINEVMDMHCLTKGKMGYSVVYYANDVDKVIAEKDNEIRRLKRALWLARAKSAEARKDYWHARSCHEGDDFLASIDGSPVKYIGCIKRTNYDWLVTWSEVEIKCRAKAEEYK